MARKRGNSLMLGFLELLFLIGLAVLLPLVLDYSITKLYLNPVLGWNFPRVFIASCVFEAVVFVVVGYYFLQEKMEEHRAHYIGDMIIPDMIRVGPFKVTYKARLKLGIALMVAGVILFIVGMFIIPEYYRL